MAGRPRDPRRDRAKVRWLESGGSLPNKQLAEEFSTEESPIDANRIRKWKSEDRWKADLEAFEKQAPKRKRGGQPGNKNAEGGGAPPGNTNAEKHGAYSTAHIADLTPDQRQYVEALQLDTRQNMLFELQALFTKQFDLENKIAALQGAEESALYIDKVVEMRVPGKGDAEQEGDDPLTIAMQTTIKASPFDRSMKLEGELNRTRGRVIKLLDSIKAYEMESRRLDLDERRYRLARQRAAGAFVFGADGQPDDGADLDDDLMPD